MALFGTVIWAYLSYRIFCILVYRKTVETVVNRLQKEAIIMVRVLVMFAMVAAAFIFATDGFGFSVEELSQD